MHHGSPIAILPGMRKTMISTAFAILLSAMSSACRLEHPPTPTAVADSTAIARALSLASVPRLEEAGASSLTVSAARIGGTFASAFEREMAAVVSFADRRSGGAGAAYTVEVQDLSVGEDSAVAIVAESTPAGTSHVRMLLLPRAEGGWRVVSKRTVSAENLPQRVAGPPEGGSLSSVSPPE
jgi:hypothetical protein